MSQWSSNLVPGAAPGANTHGGISPEDEPALVQRCRLGDGPALTLLIQRYQDRLFNALLRLCGNSHDAEELCQDTFVRFLAKIGEFRGGSSLYTWLFRIAMNLALSHRRRGGKVRLVPLEARAGQEEDLARAISDPRQATPAAQVERTEEHQRVLAALEGLEQEFRAVVVLRDVEGMDYEQIAQVLNVPVGTLKTWLYRARGEVRRGAEALLRRQAALGRTPTGDAP
jgi:RNA polymerase sigma-70 factor (ECF subfamily)